MTAKPTAGQTPETDAAELDALVIDMPGQQTTDKVVRSVIARSLELRLRAALEENERLRNEPTPENARRVRSLSMDPEPAGGMPEEPNWLAAERGRNTEIGRRCVPDYDALRAHDLALQARVRELEAALCGLTPGGSEYAGDIPACIAYVRETRHSQHETILRFKRARDEAEIKLRGAEKLLKRVNPELQEMCDLANFMSDAAAELMREINIALAVQGAEGETMTTVEMRCQKAIWWGTGFPAGLCGNPAYGPEKHMRDDDKWWKEPKIARCPRHGGPTLDEFSAWLQGQMLMPFSGSMEKKEK